MSRRRRRRRSRLAQVVMWWPHTAMTASGIRRATRRPVLHLMPRSPEWF